MPNNFNSNDKNNVNSKKNGESLLKMMARLQKEKKTAEVLDAIHNFLRLAYLKRMGIIKDDFWPGELDTPTIIINIFSEWLINYYLILRDLNVPIPLKEEELLKKTILDLSDIECDTNCFIRIKDYWFVQYKKKHALFRDLERIRYLVHLLDNPGKEFYAHQLISLVKGVEIGSHKMSPVRLNQEGLSLMELSIEKLSEKDKEKIEDISYNLWEELKSANKRSDPEIIKDAQKKWDQLRGYLDQSHGVFIHASDKGLKFKFKQRTSIEIDKARSLVTKHIRKAIKDIEKSLPSLTIHLDKSNITTGKKCYYSPHPDIQINWKIHW